MGSLRRAIEKKRNWEAWSGTVPQLMSIGATMAQVCETRRNALLATFDQETEDILQNITDDMARAVEVSSRQRQRQRIHESLEVKLTLIDGDDIVSGPYVQVLDELDRRSVTTVNFEASSSYESKAEDNVSVLFTRPKGPWRSGVMLDVKSSDQGWGRQAFVSLSDQIEKGVPRWSFLHNIYGATILYLVIYLAIYVPTDIVFWRAIDAKDRFVEGMFISLGISVICTLVSMLLNRYKVRAWVFPQFEVLADGNDSSGSRRLAYVGGVLLTIPVGILVNMMS